MATWDEIWEEYNYNTYEPAGLGWGRYSNSQTTDYSGLYANSQTADYSGRWIDGVPYESGVPVDELRTSNTLSQTAVDDLARAVEGYTITCQEASDALRRFNELFGVSDNGFDPATTEEVGELYASE